MQGKIVRGVAGFYYVNVEGAGIYECKAKGIFRNRKIKPLPGDNVELTVLDDMAMRLSNGKVNLSAPRSPTRIRR